MRAFIAVDVPEEVKERVEKLQAELRIGGLLFVRKSAMHITLQFLGEIDGGDVEEVKKAMLSAKRDRFIASLSGLSYFSPDFVKVVFAKVGEGELELKEIYARLCDALSASGIRFEGENYTPHLTVARVKHVGDRKALLDIIKDNASTEFGSFEVRSVVLKESVLTPEGPVYKDLYKLDL